MRDGRAGKIRQSRQRGMCNLQILLPLRASESHPHRQNICLTFSSLADGLQKLVINSCLVPVQWECAQHLPPPRAALSGKKSKHDRTVPALLLSHPRRRQSAASFPPPEPPHFELAEGPAAGRGGRGAQFVGPRLPEEVQAQPITILEAKNDFLKERRVGTAARESTLRKYRLMLRHWEELRPKKGLLYMKQLDGEALREFRGFLEAQSTHGAEKKLERVKAFFRFARRERTGSGQIQPDSSADQPISATPKSCRLSRRMIERIMEVAGQSSTSGVARMMTWSRFCTGAPVIPGCASGDASMPHPRNALKRTTFSSTRQRTASHVYMISFCDEPGQSDQASARSIPVYRPAFPPHWRRPAISGGRSSQSV